MMRGANRVGPGSQIGGYRLEKLLGMGGMGAVYAARQLSLGRVVALKLLRSDTLSGADERGRFVQEARVAAKLGNRNSVQVLDVGEEHGRLFIAYELIEGGTLRDRLNSGGARTPREALDVGIACADVLETLHAKGVLHRDLKPENIFVSNERGVLLGDLGLAKMLAGAGVKTEEGTILGTPFYIAPELVRGADASAASDLYALGIVLWECLAGEPPFRREEIAATLYAHVRDPVPPLSARRDDVPAELERMIGALLAKEPGERPPDARSVRDALASMRDGMSALGDPLPAIPPTPSAGVRRSAARPAVPKPVPRPGRRIGPWLVLPALTAVALVMFTRPEPAPAPPSPAPLVKPPEQDIVAAALTALARAGEELQELQKHPGSSPDAEARRIIPVVDRIHAVVDRALESREAALGSGDDEAAAQVATLLLAYEFAVGECNGALSTLLEVHSRKVQPESNIWGDLQVTAAPSQRVRDRISASAKTLSERLRGSRSRYGDARWLAANACVMSLSRWAYKTQQLGSLQKDVAQLSRRALPELVTRRGGGVDAERPATQVLAALNRLGLRPEFLALGKELIERLDTESRSGPFEPERELVRHLLVCEMAETECAAGDIDPEREAKVRRLIAARHQARVELVRRWPHHPRRAHEDKPAERAGSGTVGPSSRIGRAPGESGLGGSEIDAAGGKPGGCEPFDGRAEQVLEEQRKRLDTLAMRIESPAPPEP